MQNDELKAVVETTIKAQILRAFNEAPEAITRLVMAAIEKPVDRATGRSDGYSSDRVAYLDWLVGDELRNVARGVVQEIVTTKAEDIRAVIAAKLSSADVVGAFMKQILGVTTDDWRIKVAFGKEDERRF